MKRLSIQDFKGKTTSEKSAKINASIEFIKGGVADYCHNGAGKTPPPSRNVICSGGQY
jgi:hypothetical protein